MIILNGIHEGEGYYVLVDNSLSLLSTGYFSGRKGATCCFSEYHSSGTVMHVCDYLYTRLRKDTGLDAPTVEEEEIPF